MGGRLGQAGREAASDVPVGRLNEGGAGQREAAAQIVPDRDAKLAAGLGKISREHPPMTRFTVHTADTAPEAS